MPITIKNRTRRPLTFNLDHEAHKTELKVRSTLLAPDGRKYNKTTAKRVPRSLRLTARGTPGSVVDGLAETIAECPEVRAALRRGDVLIQTTKAKPTR